MNIDTKSVQNTLLGKQEVADMIGVSLSTLNRLIANRTITFVKIGGSVKFRHSDVLTLINQRVVKARGEVSITR